MTTESLTFTWNDLRLAGSLDLPGNDFPYPVVVMIQGSGSSDRTGNGYFLPIRDAFLSHGIATFAFDKPGCGESTGDWRHYALFSRTQQVESAIQFLARHQDIDADRIGVWGQSQGAWIVQILASRHDSLPFAIANSGPSLDLSAQDLYGCEHSLRAKGHSEPEIEQALDFLSCSHQAARDGQSFEEFESRHLSRAREESWYIYLPVDDETDWKMYCAFTTEPFDPVEAMRGIQCPFLAIFGGHDVLLPAWQCARETGEALEHAENADSTVVVFPTGDHRIHDASTGQFATGYLDLLADWTGNRVR